MRRADFLPPLAFSPKSAMVPGMEENEEQLDEAFDDEEEERELTHGEALHILKKKGIWDRLIDGKHSLRLIIGGVTEIHKLKLDPAQATLVETDTEYDSHDADSIEFWLKSNHISFFKSYPEGTEEFSALMRLREDS